jgi:hypothetical protein
MDSHWPEMLALQLTHAIKVEGTVYSYHILI